MKKKIIITLISGRVIEREITGIGPIGAPANSIEYGRLCQTIACSGIDDQELSTETGYCFIAPSQIATVAIKFESNLNLN